MALLRILVALVPLMLASRNEDLPIDASSPVENMAMELSIRDDLHQQGRVNKGMTQIRVHANSMAQLDMDSNATGGCYCGLVGHRSTDKTDHFLSGYFFEEEYRHHDFMTAYGHFIQAHQGASRKKVVVYMPTIRERPQDTAKGIYYYCFPLVGNGMRPFHIDSEDLGHVDNFFAHEEICAPMMYSHCTDTCTCKKMTFQECGDGAAQQQGAADCQCRDGWKRGKHSCVCDECVDRRLSPSEDKCLPPRPQAARSHARPRYESCGSMKPVRDACKTLQQHAQRELANELTLELTEALFPLEACGVVELRGESLATLEVLKRDCCCCLAGTAHGTTQIPIPWSEVHGIPEWDICQDGKDDAQNLCCSIDYDHCLANIRKRLGHPEEIPEDLDTGDF